MGLGGMEWIRKQFKEKILIKTNVYYINEVFPSLRVEAYDQLI